MLKYCAMALILAASVANAEATICWISNPNVDGEKEDMLLFSSNRKDALKISDGPKGFGMKRISCANGRCIDISRQAGRESMELWKINIFALEKLKPEGEEIEAEYVIMEELAPSGKAKSYGVGKYKLRCEAND